MQPIRGSTFLEEAGESLVPPVVADVAPMPAEQRVVGMVVEHPLVE